MGMPCFEKLNTNALGKAEIHKLFATIEELNEILECNVVCKIDLNFFSQQLQKKINHTSYKITIFVQVSMYRAFVYFY